MSKTPETEAPPSPPSPPSPPPSSSPQTQILPPPIPRSPPLPQEKKDQEQQNSKEKESENEKCVQEDAENDGKEKKLEGNANADDEFSDVIQGFVEIMEDELVPEKDIMTIETLTATALESSKYSDVISDLIITHLNSVPPDQRILVFYLIDSIVDNEKNDKNNTKSSYKNIFGGVIEKLFMNTYLELSPIPELKNLFAKLLSAWTTSERFEKPVLNSLNSVFLAVRSREMATPPPLVTQMPQLPPPPPPPSQQPQPSTGMPFQMFSHQQIYQQNRTVPISHPHQPPPLPSRQNYPMTYNNNYNNYAAGSNIGPQQQTIQQQRNPPQQQQQQQQQQQYTYQQQQPYWRQQAYQQNQHQQLPPQMSVRGPPPHPLPPPPPHPPTQVHIHNPQNVGMSYSQSYRTQNQGNSQSGHKSIPTPSDSASYKCAVCGCKFEKYFDKKDEKWLFRDIVFNELNNTFSHGSCIKLLEPPKMTSRPEKDKFGFDVEDRNPIPHKRNRMN